MPLQSCQTLCDPTEYSPQNSCPCDSPWKNSGVGCQFRRYKRCRFDPWVRKFTEEGSGNPLQYSGLENPMDRATWWATVHGVGKSWTLLSNFTFRFLGGQQFLNCRLGSVRPKLFLQDNIIICVFYAHSFPPGVCQR